MVNSYAYDHACACLRVRLCLQLRLRLRLRPHPEALQKRVYLAFYACAFASPWRIGLGRLPPTAADA